MSEFNNTMAAIRGGDAMATEKLLILMYAELRNLAQTKLAGEKPVQTLTPTALVHETFMRLVAPNNRSCWDTKGHFFAAASEAMRRILIDNARRKKSAKRGGNVTRIQTNISQLTGGADYNEDEQLLALHVALEQFEAEHPQEAQLVKLRFFAGLTMAEASELVKWPERTAHRKWAFAKAKLRKLMDE